MAANAQPIYTEEVPGGGWIFFAGTIIGLAGCSTH